MVLPVPYGRDYEATIVGKALREVTCESCSCVYVYEIERKGVGTAKSVLWLDNQGAASKSQREANKRLKEELSSAIDPVPCPKCGWMQKNMCAILKHKRAYYGYLFMVFGLLSLTFGWIFSNDTYHDSITDWSRTLIVAGVSGIAAGAVLALLLYMLRNPNRSHVDGVNSNAVNQSSRVCQ